ncbi:hypothetical protein KC345_g233 [Hortaea werneckii]|nr:hypothetical protein KC345_g233 [Hortaea werneckii]
MFARRSQEKEQPVRGGRWGRSAVQVAVTAAAFIIRHVLRTYYTYSTYCSVERAQATYYNNAWEPTLLNEKKPCSRAYTAGARTCDSYLPREWGGLKSTAVQYSTVVPYPAQDPSKGWGGMRVGILFKLCPMWLTRRVQTRSFRVFLGPLVRRDGVSKGGRGFVPQQLGGRELMGAYILCTGPAALLQSQKRPWNGAFSILTYSSGLGARSRLLAAVHRSDRKVSTDIFDQPGLSTSAHSHVSISERFPHHSDIRCAHSLLTHTFRIHPPACARPLRYRSLSLLDHDDIANRGVLIQARRRYRNICHAPTRPTANTTRTHRPTDRSNARSLHRTAHGRANPAFSPPVLRAQPASLVASRQ